MTGDRGRTTAAAAKSLSLLHSASSSGGELSPLLVVVVDVAAIHAPLLPVMVLVLVAVVAAAGCRRCWGNGNANTATRAECSSGVRVMPRSSPMIICWIEINGFARRRYRWYSCSLLLQMKMLWKSVEVA